MRRGFIPNEKKHICVDKTSSSVNESENLQQWKSSVTTATPLPTAMLSANISHIEKENPLVQQQHQPTNVYKQFTNGVQRQIPFESTATSKKRVGEIQLYDIPAKKVCKVQSVNDKTKFTLAGKSESLTMNSKGNQNFYYIYLLSLHKIRYIILIYIYFLNLFFLYISLYFFLFDRFNRKNCRKTIIRCTCKTTLYSPTRL